MSTVQYPDIALIGKAGAGKTTAAEILVKHYGYTRLSFAAPLKEIAVRIWGDGALTDRDKLQRLGCAVRDIDPDALCRMLVRELADADEWAARMRFVIDDCRFPNEAQALRLDGFKFVRIVAPRNMRVVRLKANGKLQDEAQLEDVSETALDDFQADGRIVNDGYSTRLAEDLADILNKWSW